LLQLIGMFIFVLGLHFVICMVRYRCWLVVGKPDKDVVARFFIVAPKLNAATHLRPPKFNKD
jgi:hypothetical protein